MNLQKDFLQINIGKVCNNIWKKLKELGLDVIVTVKDGGYFNNKETGQIAGKQYDFQFDYTNSDNKTFHFKGYLVCSFCGTVDDIMSAYDMVFILY